MQCAPLQTRGAPHLKRPASRLTFRSVHPTLDCMASVKKTPSGSFQLCVRNKLLPKTFFATVDTVFKELSSIAQTLAASAMVSSGAARTNVLGNQGLAVRYAHEVSPAKQINASERWRVCFLPTVHFWTCQEFCVLAPLGYVLMNRVL